MSIDTIARLGLSTCYSKIMKTIDQLKAEITALEGSNEPYLKIQRIMAETLLYIADSLATIASKPLT